MPIKAIIADREFYQSSTRPWLMKCTDGDYIVKFSNEITDKSLINEYVCGKLAKKIDMPVAEPQVIEIDQELIDVSNGLIERKVKAGKHYGTILIPDSTNVGKQIAQQMDIKKIVNANQVAGMIVFDTFVCNADRNADNSIIVPIDETREKYRYVLLDHGLCFGGGNWTIPQIENLPIAFSNIPWNISGITDESNFTAYIEKLKALEKKDFKEILDSVPKEWRMPELEVNALLTVLEKRDEEAILKLIKDNKQLFPNCKWI
ncbi:MAG: hypothetical protein HY223_10200 [Thaumarchaeota archaeon]|nr:hypothetical protein [Nitrososphaerota archaeon]